MVSGLTPANYPVVSSVLNASNTLVIGSLALQQKAPSSGLMSYNTNLIYNLASPVAGSYQLVAGLLEPAGGTNLAGTFSLTFEVTDSSGILVPTQTFTSLVAFDNYFSDKLLSLGTFTGAISGLDFNFGMSTASITGGRAGLRVRRRPDFLAAKHPRAPGLAALRQRSPRHGVLPTPPPRGCWRGLRWGFKGDYRDAA